MGRTGQDRVRVALLGQQPTVRRKTAVAVVQADADTPPVGRGRALAGMAGAMLLSMTTWFAAPAVVPQVRAQRALAAQTERIEVERARRAVLEERTRLARDIHDTLLQGFTGIALKLVMAERRCQARNGTPADTAPEPAAQAAAEVGMCVGTGSDWKIGRIGAGNSHAAGVRTVELFRDFRSAAHSCKHRPFPAVSSAPGLEGSS